MVVLEVAIYLLIIAVIVLLFGIHHKHGNAICRSKKRLDGKTVLVTGGTAGMGLQIAIDFAQRGARVIVACPFQNEGSQAKQIIIESSENDNVVYKHLDLSSFKSTRNFAADILKTEDRLDILVNNAGVGGPLGGVTEDGLNFVLQVNYFSSYLLTLLLLPLLKKTGRQGEPSRIVNVPSVLHYFGLFFMKNLEFYWFSLQTYANSKLYVVMFTRELAARLEGSHVVVNSADPGAVGTAIYSTANRIFGLIVTPLIYLLCKTPWEGAQTALHVALDNKTGQVSGKYFRNCSRVGAARTANNNKYCRILWEETTRLVRLTDDEFDNCFKSL